MDKTISQYSVKTIRNHFVTNLIILSLSALLCNISVNICYSYNVFKNTHHINLVIYWWPYVHSYGVILFGKEALV